MTPLAFVATGFALEGLLAVWAVAVALVTLAALASGNPFADLTLEDVITGAGFADLDASPLQRAVARAAEGRPLDGVIPPDTQERCFGTCELPSVAPLVVALVCGVRGGKSFLAACKLVHAALTADLGKLKRFEVARGVIIGPTVDAAQATFTQLAGIIGSSEVLAALVVERTADSITLQRPDGRRVELCVVAAHRGGLSVRARWLVCFVLEEVAQFGLEATGAAVSAEDILRAGITRLTPSGQAWLVSSPFGPQGLLYQTWKAYFAKPGRVLVVWASTRDLNPSYPQATIDALEAEQPDVAAREHAAAWLDAESAYYAGILVDAAMRKEPLHKVWQATGCAGDFATRSNGWTLATARSEGERIVIGAVWEWRGSKQAPLSPKQIFSEMATVLRPFGVTHILVDSWSFDAMQDLAHDVGLTLVELPATERDLPYLRLKTLLGNGSIELPPHPQLRTDLLAIRNRATAAATKVTLPRTADGRHCDLAVAVALAASYALQFVHRVVAPRMKPLNLPDRSTGDEPMTIADANTGEGRARLFGRLGELYGGVLDISKEGR
jgi:hypothetical protein